LSTSIIVIAVALDIVVTAVIVWLFLARRKAGGALLGMSLGELKRFADSSHALVGEYMRANYSGNPEQLPEVLASLMTRLEDQAKAQGLTLDRDVLRALLQRSAESHRLAKPREVQAALAKVA
jgi:hypothetical protein